MQFNILQLLNRPYLRLRCRLSRPNSIVFYNKRLLRERVCFRYYVVDAWYTAVVCGQDIVSWGLR
jgi:hypothetical protein